jgi:hypothetical protein
MISPARSAWLLHRTGCSQEDQLSRQACQRSGSAGRADRSNTLGTGRLDKDASATLDGGDGSNDFHRLDPRSYPSACLAGEGRASADTARAPSPENLWKLSTKQNITRGFPYEHSPGRCMNGHETRLPNFVLRTAKMPSNPHLRSASGELR